MPRLPARKVSNVPLWVIAAGAAAIVAILVAVMVVVLATQGDSPESNINDTSLIAPLSAPLAAMRLGFDGPK